MRYVYVLAISIFAFRYAEAIDLVRDGKPIATIVVSRPQEAADSTPSSRKGSKPKKTFASDEEFAVQTLVEWIKKITDIELHVADKALLQRPAIFVGQAAISAGLKLNDIVSASHEGLRIDADENRVLIAGQCEAATLKAVCRFLEEIGCRYLMDTQLGEVFPRSKTLSIQSMNIAEKPGLLWRNPKGPSWNARLWKAWNGAGGEPFGHSHSWSQSHAPQPYIPSKR